MIFAVIILQIFSLGLDWSKCVSLLNMHQLKLGNVRVLFPNFQNCACCGEHLKDTKHKEPPLGAKKCSNICAYTLIICSWNLTLSFPRAYSSLLGTDNVCGQISEHILAPNGGYCLYIIIVRQNNKELSDEVFVIPGIIKVEVSVISLSPRLRLITLIETLIISDITKPNLIIFYYTLF